MIPLAEARARVLAGCQPLGPRPHPLAEAQGLVIASDVAATELIPPFPNSAVDGYAVRAVDVAEASWARSPRVPRSTGRWVPARPCGS